MELLQTDTIYHIYNRANGYENLFLLKENYRYFLQKYTEYIAPIADTYCYCLMPNHFHFLVKIKSKNEVLKHYNLVNYQSGKIPERLDEESLEEKLTIFLSKQFSNLFNGYTQAFNKMYLRKGSLFMRPFKRKRVDTSIYFYRLVFYIHHNPVEAGLSKTPNGWEHSSYTLLITDFPSFLCKKDLMEWFESKSQFISFHTKHIEHKNKDFEPEFD